MTGQSCRRRQPSKLLERRRSVALSRHDHRADCPRWWHPTAPPFGSPLPPCSSEANHLLPMEPHQNWDNIPKKSCSNSATTGMPSPRSASPGRSAERATAVWAASTQFLGSRVGSFGGLNSCLDGPFTSGHGERLLQRSSSRSLQTKRFDGFVEQWECSSRKRVFGEVLLVEIQCLGDAGDATSFDEKGNVQTVSRTTASPHFHRQHGPLIGGNNLNVPQLEYRLPVRLLECRYELLKPSC